MLHNLCVSCVICMVVVMVVPAGVEVLAETGGNSYLLCPACVRPRNSQPRVVPRGRYLATIPKAPTIFRDLYSDDYYAWSICVSR